MPSDPQVFGRILTGDARKHLPALPRHSVDLSFWSPPYYVGKSYEQHLTFDEWRELVREVIACHWSVMKPGGFLVINIGDILCFPDSKMPRYQADNVGRKRCAVSREEIMAVKRRHPHATRYQLAALLGVQ